MAVTPDTLYVIQVVNLVSGTYGVHETVFTNLQTAEDFVSKDIVNFYASQVIGFVIPVAVNFE